jgi:tetratricopeptide (TPR) repeat protein
MISRRTTRITVLALAAGLFVSACQPYRNFTTYFNLFYNIERLMGEVENEMAWMRDEKSPDPVYVVPFDDQTTKGSKSYAHLERRSTSEEEMRANKIKLDSVLIKGSKLLARSAKSDYVDGAVFYIGKAYFYLHEWYQSQKKCEELIANFPESKYLPDAHLYLSMDLMRQGNVDGARTMLSRTLDVAWTYKRLDVLTDAFRLNADLELGEGNVDKALKPYQRAMLLSDDGEDRARWQYEMGVIYFRNASFEDALREFDKVEQYSPDNLTEFNTSLQRAVTLRVLGKYDEAAKALAELRSNSNYESWWGLVDVERNNLAADRPDDGTPREMVTPDTSATGKNYAVYGVYERAVRAFRAGDYNAALDGFTKVQAAVAPFQRRAARYVTLLTQYFGELVRAQQATRIMLDPFPDSTKALISDAYYNVARVFSAIDKPDSLRRYYGLALRWAPAGSLQAARAIYANAQTARSDGRTATADSLLEILVQNYSLTDYAADARARLGYTESAKIDTAEDLYVSGMAHMRVNEDTSAIAQFQRVVDRYPTSLYAPKAYYAIGLLYEQRLNERDSAFAYYTRILEHYPNSDQALAVKPIIDAVLTARRRGDSSGASGGAPAPGTQLPNGTTVPGNPNGVLIPNTSVNSRTESSPPVQGNIGGASSQGTVPLGARGGALGGNSGTNPPTSVKQAPPVAHPPVEPPPVTPPPPSPPQNSGTGGGRPPANTPSSGGTAGGTARGARPDSTRSGAVPPPVAPKNDSTKGKKRP